MLIGFMANDGEAWIDDGVAWIDAGEGWLLVYDDSFWMLSIA